MYVCTRAHAALPSVFLHLCVQRTTIPTDPPKSRQHQTADPSFLPLPTLDLHLSPREVQSGPRGARGGGRAGRAEPVVSGPRSASTSRTGSSTPHEAQIRAGLAGRRPGQRGQAPALVASRHPLRSREALGPRTWEGKGPGGVVAGLAEGVLARGVAEGLGVGVGQRPQAGRVAPRDLNWAGGARP